MRKNIDKIGGIWKEESELDRRYARQDSNEWFIS